jgi:hypothetical protein
MTWKEIHLWLGLPEPDRGKAASLQAASDRKVQRILELVGKLSASEKSKLAQELPKLLDLPIGVE